MHWWLFLFLAGNAIQVPGHFDTLDDCKAARAKAIKDFRDLHNRNWSTAWGWCVQGGRDDLK